MRMMVASSIKSTLPKIDSAKEFMKFIEQHSQAADNSFLGTLMSKLTTMKFDGSCTMHEHVIEMINLAVKLNSRNECGWVFLSTVYT